MIHSSPSPDRPEHNEDSSAVIMPTGDVTVLAVADGGGGARGGEQASQLAVETMAQSVDSCPILREAILSGLETANHAILDLGIGAFTTLAVVSIEQGEVRSYHVGDSAILVVGQRGKVKLLTTFHSPVGYAVEAGVLEESVAMHHDDRHLVSNILGSSDMKIELGPSVRLARRDTVMVASDGLFDNLRIDEIIECIRCRPLKTAASRLLKECSSRMSADGEGQPSKPDDLTFILYRLARPKSRRAGALDPQPA